MIRPFFPGNCVRIIGQFHAKASPSASGSPVAVYPHQEEYWQVIEYSKEGTEEVMEDDFVGIKNCKTDQMVWVGYSEFHYLSKVPSAKCHE